MFRPRPCPQPTLNLYYRKISENNLLDLKVKEKIYKTFRRDVRFHKGPCKNPDGNNNISYHLCKKEFV